MKNVFKFFLVLAIIAPTLITPVACSSGSVEGADITINISAQGNAFNKDRITVAPGSVVAIVFENKDSWIHNVSVYTDSSATSALFIGGLISKGKTTYTFTAPGESGTYYFRCDVHPFSMTGDFIVN